MYKVNRKLLYEPYKQNNTNCNQKSTTLDSTILSAILAGNKSSTLKIMKKLYSHRPKLSGITRRKKKSNKSTNMLTKKNVTKMKKLKKGRQLLTNRKETTKKKVVGANIKHRRTVIQQLQNHCQLKATTPLHGMKISKM